MNLTFFLQANNQFGQFLQLSLLKRLGLLAALCLLLLCYPCWSLWQQHLSYQQKALQLQQISAELQHQQRLIASLKQKQQQQLLTPQITTKVAQLDQQLQRSKHHIHILSSQWKFDQGAILQLEVESYFAGLVSFLDSFLAVDDVALLTLEIKRNEGALGNITSRLEFGLQQREQIEGKTE